ncbi:MAG: laccase domain-containing protein, partial [Candidatus Cloacimonadota bacterium]|nr:laccase domain-containing protein [Candidatus Cloacimonadota bacterium]
MIRKYFGNAFHPVSEINFDFLPGKFFTLAEQVHKNRVKIVTGEDLNAKVKMIDGYDGLVTALFDVNLIIRTADCVPVLLQDKQNK